MSKSGETSTSHSNNINTRFEVWSQKESPAHHEPKLANDEGSDTHQAWPKLSTQHGDTARLTASGSANFGGLEDSVGNLSEDIGPRTKHRKPKPKPGIPFKVLKARALAEEESDEDNGDPMAQVAILPPEILSRIFAHSDPRTIAQCASVCRSFAHVVQDDSTWRLAVSIAFGIESTDPRQATNPTMRRVDANSWRAEYVRRTERVRRWRRARAPTVLTDARIELIHSIALSLPHHFMLCSSTAYGVASRSDPFTGKVSKGYLDVSGPVQGVPLVTLGLGPAVTALRLEADATRIVWGFQHGVVGMTTLARQGTNPRGAVRGSQFSARSGHVGPVTDIALPFGTAVGGAHSLERSPEKVRQKQAMLGEASETFVTCGVDGTVRLWSPHRTVPLWKDVVHADTLADGTTKRPAIAIRVAIHLESGTIAAATSEGHIKVWSSIDINGLLAIPTRTFEDSQNTLRTVSSAVQAIYNKIKKYDLPSIHLASPESPLKLDLLVLDIGSEIAAGAHGKAPIEKIRILTFAAELSLLERRVLHLGSTNGRVDLDRLALPSKEDRLTCARPDFDVSQPLERPTNTIGLVTTVSAHSGVPPISHGSRSHATTLFTERKYVCAGTQRGRLIVWDWDQEADGLSGEIGAYLCLDAHHASITAIDMTQHAIVLGSSDGTIKAFCPLSGQLLRTFNDRTATRHPARMLAAGQLTEEQSSRFYVTQIIASEDTIVAAIGSQVLAWQAEKLRSKNQQSRKSTSRTGRNTIGRLWDPKVQSSKEMERDVYETQRELEQEHQERLANHQRLGGGGLASDLDDLTEQEAFEYAMMLSRDEMDAGSGETDAKQQELSDALEQIARAEGVGSQHGYRGKEDDWDDDRDEPDTSRDDGDDSARYLQPHRSSMTSSRSTSPLSSPYLRAMHSPQSRAWDIVQNAGSSVMRNKRVGDAHSKVQSVHVPQAARAVPNAPLTSRRSSSHANVVAHSFDSPDDWPSFDLSQSRSPTRLDLDGTAPPSSSRHASFSQAGGVRQGTSPSPLPSSVTARSPLGGAWASGSPSLRPVNVASRSSVSPSALAESRPQEPRSPPTQSQSIASNGSLDDDLRFALELSLAEERSRHEQDQAKGKGKERLEE